MSASPATAAQAAAKAKRSGVLERRTTSIGPAILAKLTAPVVLAWLDAHQGRATAAGRVYGQRIHSVAAPERIPAPAWVTTAAGRGAEGLVLETAREGWRVGVANPVKAWRRSWTGYAEAATAAWEHLGADTADIPAEAWEEAALLGVGVPGADTPPPAPGTCRDLGARAQDARANLKSAVLRRLSGEAPVFNPRYVDFARHYGFEIAPCNVGAGHEKGRVEAGVGYVKKNLLAGLEIADFSHLNPTAREWLDTVANVRIHGETRRRPIDLFEEERDRLQPLPETVHDFANIHAVRASNRFRVTFDANRYSVPAEYASQRLTLKAWPDRICIYHHDRLVARHPRSYDRHQDFEHPDHPKALLDQRRSARRQRLVKRFLTLAPCAERYYAELQQRRLNPTHHIRKIVALSEVHGEQDTARALADALHFGALGSEYIANLLESRARLNADPGPLHLTRPGDALELDLPDPDLADYDRHLETENTP